MQMIDNAFAEEAAKQSLAVNWVSGEHICAQARDQVIHFVPRILLAASITCLIYDHFLTFSDEVSLVLIKELFPAKRREWYF